MDRSLCSSRCVVIHTKLAYLERILLYFYRKLLYSIYLSASQHTSNCFFHYFSVDFRSEGRCCDLTSERGQITACPYLRQRSNTVHCTVCLALVDLFWKHCTKSPLRGISIDLRIVKPYTAGRASPRRVQRCMVLLCADQRHKSYSRFCAVFGVLARSAICNRCEVLYFWDESIC